MSTLAAPPLPPPPALLPARFSAPHPRRWTKAEYYKMWELGWFEDQRIELIDGEVMQMANLGPAHVVTTDKVARVLETVFPIDDFWVRRQSALNLGLDVEPQPDVAVADGPMSSYLDRHPTTAVLVVEVSDTTLAYDRGRKAGLYARGGIADYWIVNLELRQLEVHRRPMTDATAAEGYRYDEKIILGEAEVVTPLAAPQVVLRVAALLP